MTSNSNFYERVRSLKDGNEIILEPSKSSYFFKAALSLTFLIWGLLSVLYWFERSLINKKIAQFIAPTILPGAEVELEIIFGMGLVGLLFIPWIIQIFCYPTSITMNNISLVYKTRGRTQKIPWDQVIEIKSFYLSMDEREGGKELVEVKGKHGCIMIESQYNFSTKKLIELLLDCWKSYAKENNISSYTESTDVTAERSEVGTLFTKLVSINQEKQRKENRTSDAVLRRLFIFSLLLVVFAVATATFAVIRHLH